MAGGGPIAEHRVFGLVPLSRFYRGRKATWLGKLFSRFWAAWSALGLPSYRMVELRLTGRKTGKPVRLAVVVAELAGRRYLVSMLGECAWVRNARANPDATIVRMRRRPVRLEEVPVAERAAIIQAYLRVAPGARPHIGLGAEATLEECERVAADHPVFRIVELGRWT
jgi:deazaflavin-dependent oxidoreductase (nitroreductase family)